MLCGFHNRPFHEAKIILLLTVCLTGACCAFATPGSDADISRTQASAESGRAQKEVALGDAYFAGHGVPQDPKLAAYWYEKAAGFGDPVAQNQIGYLYQIGLGVSPDAARAVHWYRLSAASGLTRAKVNLGVAYFWGTGVERDTKTAERFFMEAANKGDSMACAYLGDMYFFGEGVPQDQAAGERWYESAVKMHNYLAAYRLGKIFSEPSGHARNIERALLLFRESAAAGFVPSMHSAGLLLVNHPEVDASHEEALSLLNESASAGIWKSSIVLGVLARDGKWVTQNPGMAYFHFRVAILQGGDAAKAMLTQDIKVLSVKINPEELTRINDEASAWTQKHNRTLEVVYKGGKKAATLTAFALAVPQSGEHAGPLLPLAPL